VVCISSRKEWFRVDLTGGGVASSTKSKGEGEMTEF